jgi:hypothetical protein
MAQRKKSDPAGVPEFKNEREMAEYWDNHSPLHYPDHFEEAEAEFSRPLIKKGLTIKLNEQVIEQLREIGRELGVGPSTLARMWILEHLKERSRTQP